MKNLRTVTLSLVLLFGAAMSIEPDGKASTIKDAVNTYIGAIVHGPIKNFGSVVAQHVKFIMRSGKGMLAFTGAEISSFLMENQNGDQGCTINTSLTNNSNELAVVKVDMVYKDFTRTNHVTLVNTANGWKITEVCAVFK